MSSTMSSPILFVLALAAFDYLFKPAFDYLADYLNDYPACLIEAPAALYVLIND